jgi:hypothetical protein
MKTHISFIRKDVSKIDNMVIIQYTHKKALQTPKDVFDAFRGGITQWVEETEEGKNLWNYSSEDLNIGDILGENKNKTLSKFLLERGIKKWKPIYELVDQEEYSYDKVLANPKETNI